jgi:pimeloyl-ACP methyl ester carboxylesterase
MTTPTPFRVTWNEADIGPVLDRVRHFRFPPAPENSGWTYGCDPDFLRRLCTHWTDRFDWRAAVDALNRFPQFIVDLDGFPIHFLHVVGEAEGRRPLLMTHGWPGSHAEFWDVIEPLAFPSRHGGQPEDAFDLVIPSLPGFGFSGRPTRPFDQQRATAHLFDLLMTTVLGYPRYLAHGGDWGAVVTAQLALEHADHVRAIHLTMLFPQPDDPPQTPDEQEWAARQPSIEATLGGYRHLQGSKPLSLSYAMVDNPVAQAAWIVERFHDWADLRERAFEDVFPFDRLLTNVMIYVMTDAFPISTWFYAAARESGMRVLKPGQLVAVPTAFACFPDPLHPWPPRARAEKGYNVTRWTTMAHGGHFTAMEAPDLLVPDLRAWAAETPD